MSDFYSWVPQVLPMGGGFVGAKRCIDLGSGAEQLQLFRLTAAGQVATVLPLDHAGPGVMDRLGRFQLPAAAHYPSLLLAASGSPALRGRFTAASEQVQRAAPQGIFSVVSLGEVIWALEGDPYQAEVTQRLHRLDLRDPDRLQLQSVPLQALNLTPKRRITALAGFGGQLHVAVSDPLAGFDLFRIDNSGPQAGFQPVLHNGAQRFALNAMVSAMAICGDQLLLGTAALASDKGPVGQWGPELLALDAGGSWDLVIGQPRFTADGLRFPGSGLLPGLGRLDNAAIRAIACGAVADGVLTCIAVQDFVGPPVEDRRRLAPDLLNYAGATRLYASQDLEDWYAVAVTLPPASGAVTSLAVSGTGILIGHEGLSPDEIPVTFVPH